MNLKKLYELWDELSDVPVDDTGHIETPFLHFLVGEDREEIWHWFEEQNDDFIVGEVMNGHRRGMDNPMTDAEYVKHEGAFCPRCGSDDIEAIGGFEIEGNTVTERIMCNYCDLDWDDVYELKGYIPRQAIGKD